MENARAMVDAIQMLKREYYVSSISAFEYLKIQKRYQQLWEKMKREHTNCSLSLREFTNFIDCSAAFMKTILDLHEVRSVDFHFQANSHEVCKFGSDESMRSYVPGEKRWHLLFESLVGIISDYAKSQGIQSSTAFHSTKMWEEAWKDAKLPILESDSCEFMNVTQALRKISNEAEERCKNGYVAEPWNSVITQQRKHLSHAEIEEILSKEEDYINKESALRILENDISCFYPRSQNLNSTTSDEYDYLYYDCAAEHDPMQRSVLEYTRNRLETERRFALQAIISAWDLVVGLDAEFDARFENAFSNALLGENLGLEMFGGSEPDTKKNTISYQEACRYRLLCLKKNKRWLKTFLSR